MLAEQILDRAAGRDRGRRDARDRSPPPLDDEGLAGTFHLVEQVGEVSRRLGCRKSPDAASDYQIAGGRSAGARDRLREDVSRRRPLRSSSIARATRRATGLSSLLSSSSAFGSYRTSYGSVSSMPRAAADRRARIQKRRSERPAGRRVLHQPADRRPAGVSPPARPDHARPSDIEGDRGANGNAPSRRLCGGRGAHKPMVQRERSSYRDSAGLTPMRRAISSHFQ